MKLGVLFSGGKDSCLALHKVLKEGHSVEYLLNIVPDNFDSFMFHKPYLDLLERQARELGMSDRLIIIKSKGEKEKELKELEEVIFRVKDDVEGIVAGGIASNYQVERVKKICDCFGLKLVLPILGYKPKDVWNELAKEGFEVILTKIACDGLDSGWLGKIIDSERLKRLKEIANHYKVRLDFEGGEAESAVLFMPEFKKRIEIDFSVKSEGSYRHWIDKLVVR